MPGAVAQIADSSLQVHSRITADDATQMLAAADKENKAGDTGWSCCSVAGEDGTEEILRVRASWGDDKFEPDALTQLTDWLKKHRITRPVVIPVDSTEVLLDAKAAKKTWRCPEFPTTPQSRNPLENLYAMGSVCGKLDQLMDRNQVRAYELLHHQTLTGTWQGFCDKAARVSALLQEPQKEVTVQGVKGLMKFTKEDIMGLLVMVSGDLKAPNEPFVGHRNHGKPGDDISDPYPHELIPALSEFLKAGDVVVASITNRQQVRNYPYDRSKIDEFLSPRDGMEKVSPQKGGVIKYQTIELESTGYPDKARHYKSWVEYDPVNSQALASGWFGDPNNIERNPDFIWVPRARGDLSKKENWPKTCTHNPHVDPQWVFEVYRQSILSPPQ